VPVISYPRELIDSFADEARGASALFNTTTLKSVISSPHENLFILTPASICSFVNYVVESFNADVLSFAAPLPGFPTPSAWPPTRDFALLPSEIWYVWNSTADDAVITSAQGTSAARLRAKAVQLGQVEADPSYPGWSAYANYAPYWFTKDDIWGENVDQLEDIKAIYDPDDVMGLTGGFKLD
jgi:hypothetical protein